MLLDIDECSTGEHNCAENQQCVNKPGDYQCECVSGYELLNGNCEGNLQLHNAAVHVLNFGLFFLAFLVILCYSLFGSYAQKSLTNV